MDGLPPEPTLHLEDLRRGTWSVRISRRGSLEAMVEQMKVIDGYRGGNWPQRITDDSGKVLLQNEAARLVVTR